MTRKKKLPELELTVEEITPEIAEQWLQKNTHNRNKSDRLVDLYAEAMRNDEWTLNGEPIIFDKTDRLQSGQHRLWAVIQADVPIWSVVVRGAEPEGIYTLDTGRKRRMTDALTLRGEKDVNNLATLLVWVWRWEHGLMDRNSIIPTNSHLLKVLDERPELRTYLSYGQRLRRYFKISVGLAGALAYQLGQIDSEDMEVFFEALTTGENLYAQHPCYAWRRWMQRQNNAATKTNASVVAAITVKAWNAFRQHEDVKAFRWAANELFPEAL